MCHDADSHPPIAPIAGAALDSSHLTLTARDGNRFSAFRARPVRLSGAGVLLLPDIRGLHSFYPELALRFAEAGMDTLAIDQYGRTAGTSPRGPAFEHMAHVPLLTYAGLTADIAAAVGELRGSDERDAGPIRALFAVGFCAGGRLAFDAATMGLDLAGVVGFYGFPTGAGRNDVPAPVDLVDRMTCPVLGLFGGADGGIPISAVEEFERALGRAGVEHRIVTYPDAPHSFFDRAAAEHAAAAADAWQQVLEFIAERTPPAPG